MKADAFVIKAGVLNSEPQELHEVFNERVKYDYENLCDKFLLKNRNYERQFFHLYSVRLSALKDHVIKRAKDYFGTQIPIKTLVELKSDSGEKCIIIGTLFKHQELKPSILKEISEDFQLVPQQKQTKFICETDELILEDELQRIRLVGSVDVSQFVTGIVCAVKGSQDSSGKFCTEDICLPGPVSVPKPFSPLPVDRYVVLVSGLDMAHNADLVPLQLLLDWVTGWSGEPAEQSQVSSIALVIIAGGVVRSMNPDRDGTVVGTKISSSADLSSTLSQLDSFLTDLSDSVDVDMMPGEFDPTSYQLPQQPMHLCMFPKSGKSKSMRSCTNPYWSRVCGRLVGGTSGQPLADLARYSAEEDPLTLLQSTLNWGHLAPTAPDTLPCYPYKDKDPFIMDTQPDVYFAGNQKEFQTKYVTLKHSGDKEYSSRLVCVPGFLQSRTCALISLSTLECHPVTFSAR